jgi:hypothetical protein
VCLKDPKNYVDGFTLKENDNVQFYNFSLNNYWHVLTVSIAVRTKIAYYECFRSPLHSTQSVETNKPHYSTRTEGTNHLEELKLEITEAM